MAYKHWQICSSGSHKHWVCPVLYFCELTALQYLTCMSIACLHNACSVKPATIHLCACRIDFVLHWLVQLSFFLARKISQSLEEMMDAVYLCLYSKVSTTILQLWFAMCLSCNVCHHSVHSENTHTHTTILRLCILSGTTQVSRYQKKHSPLTPIMVISHPLSASSIYYDPWHPPWSIYMPDSLFPQSPSFLWCTSLPGTPHFILHTFLHPVIVRKYTSAVINGNLCSLSAHMHCVTSVILAIHITLLELNNLNYLFVHIFIASCF